jgi:hypothetical protein
MAARSPLRRFLAASTARLLATAALATAALGNAPRAAAATVTTAWQNGAFSENTGGVVSRSDIILGQPNILDSQSLPLGNGSLGAAAWAANGFTAQLNRASAAIGSLAQTWADNFQSGSSGENFGVMAAITAGGQNVTAPVVTSTQVQVSFNPNSDGSFRVIVAARPDRGCRRGRRRRRAGQRRA